MWPANQSKVTVQETQSVISTIKRQQMVSGFTMFVTTIILKTPRPNYNKYAFIHVLFSAVAKLERGAICLHIFNFFNIFQPRKVWLSKSLRKDIKIRIFNACVKTVLLYGCETWLVTNEIQRKIQTFVNRCLRYIIRIWWPNIISNKDLWKATGQEDINLEIRKRKFRWIGHTLRKEDGEIPKAALH